MVREDDQANRAFRSNTVMAVLMKIVMTLTLMAVAYNDDRGGCSDLTIANIHGGDEGHGVRVCSRYMYLLSVLLMTS